MGASAKKAKVTQEERQLKSMGAHKLHLAKSLTGGRDFLEGIASADTSGREAEKLRSDLAVQLSGMNINDAAQVNAIDSRTAANSGVAALATSEEERLGANLSLINADLGQDSAATASLRSTAQSKAQLEEARLRAAIQKEQQNQEIAGTVLGAGLSAVNFGGVDPLANANQTAPNLKDAVLTNPNTRVNNGFDFSLNQPPQIRYT